MANIRATTRIKQAWLLVVVECHGSVLVLIILLPQRPRKKRRSAATGCFFPLFLLLLLYLPLRANTSSPPESGYLSSALNTVILITLLKTCRTCGVEKGLISAIHVRHVAGHLRQQLARRCP